MIKRVVSWPGSRWRRLAMVVAVGGLVFLVSCGGSADEVSSDATDSGGPPNSAAAAGQPTDPAPHGAPAMGVPQPDGTFPDDTMVQCGNPPLFAAGALTNPALLQDTSLVDERALAPLEEFLGSGEGGFWPQTGYWVLANDEQSLLLAHIGADAAVTLIGSEFDGQAWRPSALQTGGPCPIQVPLPAGVHEVNWRVDPANPPTATSSSIALLATGQACSGGQPMGDRLQPPELLITDDTVYLMLVATELAGAQECPGNPEEPVVVQLGEPLGDRMIVDARSAAGLLTDYLPASP